MLFRKEKEISGHAGAIYTCTSEENSIFTGSGDKYVARWNSETGVQDKFAIQFDESVYAICFLSKRMLAVGLSNGHLHIFDLEKNAEIKFFTQHTKAIFSIAFNAHKQQFYVADADGNLSIWSSETLSLLLYLPLDAGKIRDIAINQSGENIALACQDGTIRVFECSFFNEIKTLKAHKNGATAVMFHPTQDNQLISGGKDALLKLWDLETEACLKEIPAHNFAIYSIQALNEGQTIVTASRDKTIKIWSDTLEFQQRLDFKVGGHRHSVNSIRVMDEIRFVSVSDDKKIIVWESGFEETVNP